MQEQKKKKDETEGYENERASNYMTGLAPGSLWLNRAPFPDITPQSFHNILPLSLMPVIFSSAACEAVCVYVCVFSHFGPTRTANSGTSFSLWSPAFSLLSVWVILATDILTQRTRWGLGCVLCVSFFVRVLRGITTVDVTCLLLLLCSGSYFFGHWITRLTLCWRNSRLSAPSG